MHKVLQHKTFQARHMKRSAFQKSDILLQKLIFIRCAKTVLLHAENCIMYFETTFRIIKLHLHSILRTLLVYARALYINGGSRNPQSSV